ncbi:hypothetical protein JCM21900_005519 [Sporobolomyces salmonicolor]
MRAAVLAVSLASLAGLAAAQTGYGRFPCTIVNGDNTFSPDQTQCADSALVAPGADESGTGAQGDRPNPTDSVCTMETESGAYFCGIAGATCTTDANCDNGPCTGGICQGGFTQACGGDDLNCSGYLYCQSGDYTTTAADTCGAVGAFCQDYTQGSTSFTDAQNYAIFNQFCSTGYCNFGTGNCDVHGTTVGVDCSSDPEFYCTSTSTGQGLTCDTTSYTCQLAVAPSGRARSRRNELARRNLCPASHSACAIDGKKGFECIDTLSNLEQCGACASNGGVDCTSLAGVEAVGCVAGVCEIWSCQDGYAYNAETSACEASLLI